MKKRYRSRKARSSSKKKYGKYLLSSRWKQKRNRIMRKAGGRCRCCGKRATAVHHETYGRRGREKDVDLTAVCNPCHARIHGKR